MKRRNEASGRMALALAAAALILAVGAGAALAKKADAEQDAWLGVVLQDVHRDMAKALELDDVRGALISGVDEESPAAEAGIEDGDVVIAIEGEEVADADDLVRLIGEREPGDKVEVVVLRDGERRKMKVVLGEKPERAVRRYIIRSDDDDQVYEWYGHGEDFDPEHFGEDFEDIDVYVGKGGEELMKMKMSGGWLGVRLQNLGPQLGEYFDVKDGHGALVGEVVEDSPAAEAGLRAGDVIIEVAGEKTDGPGAVTRAVRKREKGDEVKIVVVRKGREKTFEVTLAENPDRPEWKHYAPHAGMKDIMKQHRMQELRRMPRKERRIEIIRDDDELDELREELQALREELKELREELKK